MCCMPLTGSENTPLAMSAETPPLSPLQETQPSPPSSFSRDSGSIATTSTTKANASIFWSGRRSCPCLGSACRGNQVLSVRKACKVLVKNSGPGLLPQILCAVSVILVLTRNWRSRLSMTLRLYLVGIQPQVSGSNRTPVWSASHPLPDPVYLGDVRKQMSNRGPPSPWIRSLLHLELCIPCETREFLIVSFLHRHP